MGELGQSLDMDTGTITPLLVRMSHCGGHEQSPDPEAVNYGVEEELDDRRDQKLGSSVNRNELTEGRSRFAGNQSKLSPACLRLAGGLPRNGRGHSTLNAGRTC